jgi:DNA processing protein
MPDDIDALLILHAAGGALAPRRALLETAAMPAAALRAGPRAWRRHGLDDAQVQALQRPDPARLANSRDWLRSAGHHLVGWHDPDYPALLRRISSPPLALFVAGDPALLWHPAVAIVGSRSPSAGGRDNAFDFARALAASGLAVASGLAAGIDTAAHEGALAAGGTTVAVLGTGPDVPYPRANTALHARIAAAGAVVSEHPPGTGAQRGHFPSRNRILAGLSLATLVVEAAQRSGALITARLAGEAGREVFAVPGSIHNPLAHGCHRLIRDGAGLVESAQEVIDMIGPQAAGLAEALRGRLAAPTSCAAAAYGGRLSGSSGDDPDYQRLWQAIGHDPTGMDHLVSRTGLTAAELSSMLLVMELEGRVVVEHGRYSRKR